MLLAQPVHVNEAVFAKNPGIGAGRRPALMAIFAFRTRHGQEQLLDNVLDVDEGEADDVLADGSMLQKKTDHILSWRLSIVLYRSRKTMGNSKKRTGNRALFAWLSSTGKGAAGY